MYTKSRHNDDLKLFYAAVTVTTHVAVYDPSAVVAVIVAVPALTPVTVPSDATAATVASLEANVTVVVVALVGVTVATNLSVALTAKLSVVLFSATPVTATGEVILTIHSLGISP